MVVLVDAFSALVCLLFSSIAISKLPSFDAENQYSNTFYRLHSLPSLNLLEIEYYQQQKHM